jgi:hypothetical protein
VCASFGNGDKNIEIERDAAFNLDSSIMAFDFQTYLRARDNFCYCYYGNYKEFIWQLLQVRQLAKQIFPGINVFISCATEIAQSIKEEGIIDANEFKKYLFLKTEEITFDMQENPILKIFNDSKMTSNHVPCHKKSTCFINTVSKVPFKSCDKSAVICKLSNRFEIIDNEENADVICATENETLYKAAYLGKNTILIGESKVYEKLFPANENLII